MKTSDVKEIYNYEVAQKYKGEYEYARWFQNPILKAGYDMTRETLEKRLLSPAGKFQTFLELGSGAGTWTKILASAYPQAQFDLVDISLEMIKIAKNALSDFQNIDYFESDFIDFNPGKKYDLFFSSRAIEYFPDKERLIKHIVNLVNKGGSGFIITKTPKYFINKLLGRNIKEFHQGQIQPQYLKKILQENNCGQMEFYPVAMSFPVFKSAWLNKALYNILGKYKLNIVSQFFSESYCVKFIKQ